MRVLITGTTSGIGKVIALLFLKNGHEVIGMDILPSSIQHTKYTHLIKDILRDELEDINDIDILINNAGVQDSGNDIDINLKGTIRITEKYGVQQHIKSVLFIASASATSGAEFPEYAASKGGMISYMKNVALRIAQYNATSNSISPGGVTTELNRHVMEDPILWKQIMDETLIPKWASPEEIAQWAYFVTVINQSMTAQDILIDNGEAAKANFVW